MPGIYRVNLEAPATLTGSYIRTSREPHINLVTVKIRFSGRSCTAANALTGTPPDILLCNSWEVSDEKPLGLHPMVGLHHWEQDMTQVR